MRRIGHVQETPGDVEVVVLKLTTGEHEELHRGALDYVNLHQEHFFGKKVKKVVLSPESHPPSPSGGLAPAVAASTETWMVLVAHRPACTCAGTCTPLKES